MTLRERLRGPGGVLAPLVVNPLTALMAADAGFHAGYLGGGALGFLNGATEATLGLTEMAQLGLAIRSATNLPLILDGICGWGDPMHVRHTIRTAEAAGFVAIEIEDQILPKRAHHHVGIEHVVPLDRMVAKVREAVAARQQSDFLIIARTNAARIEGIDDALRRADAMHRAGADVLLVMAQDPEQLRLLAARLPPPLMYMLPVGGVGAAPIPISELWALGFTLVVDAGSPLFAMSHALRGAYAALAAGAPSGTCDGAEEELALHRLVGLDRLLQIERRTVESC